MYSASSTARFTCRRYRSGCLHVTWSSCSRSMAIPALGILRHSAAARQTSISSTKGSLAYRQTQCWRELGLFRVASRACPIAPGSRPAALSDSDHRYTPRCPHQSRTSLQHSCASCRSPDRARRHRRNARGARRASLDHAYRRRHRRHTHRRIRTAASTRRYIGEPGSPMYRRPLEQTVVRKRGPRHEAGVVFEHLVLRPT